MSRRLVLLTLIIMFTGALQAANLKPYTGKDPTPQLKLMDMQGNSHDLNDYRGQIVLVQFWATYCAPCRTEMPSMNALMKKMGDTPFKILAVDMGESRAEVEQFVEQVKPEFTILMDESGQSIAQWKVFAAPSNFVIGPDGKIHYTLFGAVEWDSETMVAQLKALASN